MKRSVQVEVAVGYEVNVGLGVPPEPNGRFDVLPIVLEADPGKKKMCDAHPSPIMRSPNNLWQFVPFGPSNVRLVGENPTFSVPALQGSDGLRPYDYGHE